MEFIKKEILQILTTGMTSGGVVIIPDKSITYHMKFGLISIEQDIGFFDAAAEGTYDGTYYNEGGEYGGETFFALDYAGNIYTDNSGNEYIID